MATGNKNQDCVLRRWIGFGEIAFLWIHLSEFKLKAESLELNGGRGV
jgi:hypothetical protein